MEPNDKQFIEKIQTALKRDDQPDLTQIFGPAPDDVSARLDRFKNKSDDQKKHLLEDLIQNAAKVNTRVHVVDSVSQAADEIGLLVQRHEPEWGTQKSVAAWDHPLINSLNLAKILKPLEVELLKTGHVGELPDARRRDVVRQDIIRSFIGITSADFVLAQTATLVLRTAPGQPRAVSVVPSIHIAVVPREQILENLTELYFRLNQDPEEKDKGLTNCMTFITGPSKTADIELTLVHGAHGPRQLDIIVIQDN